MALMALALPTGVGVGVLGHVATAAAEMPAEMKAELPAPVPNGSAGEHCSDETYRWPGIARLGEGVVFVETGVVIPAASGVGSELVGVSADGVDATGLARALLVTIGGEPAVAGAVVSGGVVAVHAVDQTAVDFVGVTVVVRRCTLVQSLATAELPSGPARLPSTGAEIELLVAASFAVAAGLGLVVAARGR